MKAFWRYLQVLVRIEVIVALTAVGASLLTMGVLTVLGQFDLVEHLDRYAYREYRLDEGADVPSLISELAPYAGSIEPVRHGDEIWLRFEKIHDVDALNREAKSATRSSSIRLDTDLVGFSVSTGTFSMSTAFGLTVQFALFALVGWWFGRRFWPQLSPRGRPWAVGIVGAAIALAGGWVLELVMSSIGRPLVEQQVVLDWLRGPGWPTAMFFIVIAAPIGEELLFRGWILNALRKVGPDWLAILVSSVLFAAIHFHPPAIPAYLLFGAILGWVYLKSGSLVAPVVTHLLINLVSSGIILAR